MLLLFYWRCLTILFLRGNSVRLHVLVIVVILGSIVGILGAKLIVSHTTIVPEETPIVALKPTIKEAVVTRKKSIFVTQQMDNPTVETSETMRVVQATVCTTTPQQQEDLRALGFDPCLTTKISVR